MFEVPVLRVCLDILSCVFEDLLDLPVRAELPFRELPLPPRDPDPLPLNESLLSNPEDPLFELFELPPPPPQPKPLALPPALFAPLTPEPEGAPAPPDVTDTCAIEIEKNVRNKRVRMLWRGDIPFIDLDFGFEILTKQSL